MARPSGNPIQRLGYGPHEVLHDYPQILTWRTQYQMQMIGHQNNSVNLDAKKQSQFKALVTDFLPDSFEIYSKKFTIINSRGDMIGKFF